MPEKTETASDKTSYSLLNWVWPVVIGAIMGSAMVTPFLVKPYPSVGAGLGGFAGLVVASILRVVRAHRKPE